ncbi:tetratricopeptide repeat protein [Virgisporangium ochraceum]
MELAALLTRLRQDRGLSQEELSHASGVSVRTVRNLERGVTRPHPATVAALADGLRLTDEERRRLKTALGTTDPGGRRAGGLGTVPAPANGLVGRRSELAILVRLVRGTRLVTVVGPGGVGKSRLALEVAWHLVGTFDHMDVVDLGPLRDRDEVRGALAAAAGPGTVASPSAIARRIGDQKRLLVLDGVEHVSDLGPDLAALVDRCPRLHLLLTGRRPPSPAGTVWTLDPLAVPGPATTDPAAALASPAVELLVERARARRPDFRVDRSTVEEVVSVCRRLDGLPLAIELAAGMLGEHDILRVAAELTVRTLRTDLVDVPPRHHSLTDTVDWSIALLDDVDRLVFRVLGAFRGRVMLDGLAAELRAASPVGPVAGPPARLAAASLTRLAAASLVRLVGDDGSTAVDVLDTIREVAHDRLREAGLADACGHAHATYMLTVLRSGGTDAVARQFDDVRAAVEFACAGAPELLDGGVVSALAEHLTARGRFAEAHRLLRAVATATADPGVAGSAWLRAGIAANHHGDHRGALACGHAAARSGGADGDLAIAARNLVGAAHKSLGDLDLAHEAYLACLADAEAVGENRYVTVALNNLGTVAHERGDLDLARDYYQRSLDIKTGLGDERGIATALVNLGGLDLERAQPVAALGLLTQALTRFRRLGEPHAVAFTLALLAGAELASDHEAAAARCAEEATRLATGADNAPIRAMACQASGDLARARGDMATAAACYARGLAFGPEPFERARLLDRLAVATLDSAPDQAVAHAAEATGIRRRYGYAVPPVDEPLHRAAVSRTYSA